MSDPHPTQRSSALGLLQVCLAGVLWGTGGLVATLLHDRDGLGATTVSAWRMLVAAVALLAVVATTGRLAATVAAARQDPARMALVGCGTAVYQLLYLAAVLQAGVSVATVVSLGLAPVLAAAWEHLRAGTRPPLQQILVLASGLAGLALMSATAGHGAGGVEGGSPTLGLVLAVIAGVVYAATTLGGHALAARVDPLAITTGTTTAGAVLLLPFFAITQAKGDPVGSTDPGSVTLLLYLGLGTMALSYALLYAGLRTTSGSAATVATLLEPISAALLAMAVLGERLTLPAIVGAALILLAVAGLRPREEHPAPV